MPVVDRGKDATGYLQQDKYRISVMQKLDEVRFQVRKNKIYVPGFGNMEREVLSGLIYSCNKRKELLSITENYPRLILFDLSAEAKIANICKQVIRK